VGAGEVVGPRRPLRELEQLLVLGDGQEVGIADGVVDRALGLAAATRGGHAARVAVADGGAVAHALEGLPLGVGEDLGGHLLASGRARSAAAARRAPEPRLPGALLHAA